jgi:two-component system, chemotaxis family, chemotaxis protein CheY
MKMLIVDDEMTNRKLLMTMLEDLGSCDLAVNGKEAVDLFKGSMENKDFYDIIFLDIKMPVMDGHEALQTIREIEESKGVMIGNGVKVVMVSALGDKNNILASFQEGCEYYLVKPFLQNKLYQLIEEMGFPSNS